MPLVLPELLEDLVEVAELYHLPEVGLPVVVGEAEVEAEREVGEVVVGGEVHGDGHQLRGHHWSGGGWGQVVITGSGGQLPGYIPRRSREAGPGHTDLPQHLGQWRRPGA